MRFPHAVLLWGLVASACARPAAPPSPPSPVVAPVVPAVVAPDSAPPPVFPPPPLATGALALRVVYPPEGARVAARDSTFLFGSLGRGDARLRVDGVEVPVLPNGAWLAWVPLPPAEAPTWTLEAVSGADTVRRAWRIVRPAPRRALPDSGPLVVDSASVLPAAGEGRLGADLVRVSVRAPATSVVRVVPAEGRAVPLVRVGGESWATELPAAALRRPARLQVERGRDTVRLTVPRVALVDSAGPRYVRLRRATGTDEDPEALVIARPLATGGTYKWFFLPGTVLEATGHGAGMVRVRLDGEVEAWVDGDDAEWLPAGTPAPVRVAGNARVVARGADASDLVIPMAERPAHAVRASEAGLELELYGTVGNTDILRHDAGDAVVRRVTWAQVGRRRVRYTLALRGPAFGYQVRWERGAFVLRVRGAPAVDVTRPLAGLTIAVDAGHPPAGSTGPTGLYEAEATLAIAERVRGLLEAEGARVLMTRTTAAPVALGARPALARAADAHAFVSVHLNALPDGVNPYTAHGTGTYYFTEPSEALARAVQAGMVRRMGLRDLGIHYDNLAVVRGTWMPSVLCEGAFVMLPEQEAWLRTAAFQQAYARGVVEGVRAYFAWLGAPAGVR